MENPKHGLDAISIIQGRKSQEVHSVHLDEVFSLEQMFTNPSVSDDCSFPEHYKHLCND